MNSKMTSFSLCSGTREYWNIQGSDSIEEMQKHFKKWNYYISNQLSFIGNFFKCIFQKVLISRHGNMRDTVQVKWVQEITISFAFYVSFHFEQIY